MMPTEAVLPLFAETGVQVGPVQTELVIARLAIDGRKLVGMQVVTPAGASFYFFEPDQAIKVADDLRSAATGIVLSSPQLAESPFRAKMES